MQNILVIIPAYNEQDNIASVIGDIRSNAPWVDLFVVNDCSTDNTADVLHRLGVPHVNLSVNLGIGGAVQTGYIYARNHGCDIAVQFDGDGQHDARYIKDLTTPIELGVADVVVGSRFIGADSFQSSIIRRCGIRFLSILLYCLTGVKIKDITSGFRAVDCKMIELFAKHYAQDYPEPEALMFSFLSSAKICEIPVIMHERTSGKSSISSLSSIYYMIKVSVALITHRLVWKKAQ